MDMEDAERRYRNDPLFHALVDSMMQGMELLQFSPGELRQASVFAEVVFLRRHAMPMGGYKVPDFEVPTIQGR